MTKKKDAKRRLLKHNIHIKSLEDLMKALLTSAFFSALLFTRYAATSISPIDSDNHLINRDI